ncbi:MAG: hypothetical protein ACLQIB_06200 [Isosphaeraceae bacterium]
MVDHPCEHHGIEQFRQHDQRGDIINPDVHDLHALHWQSTHDQRRGSFKPAFVELFNHARQHGLIGFEFDSYHNIIVDGYLFRHVRHTIFDLDTNVIDLDTDDIVLIHGLDGLDSRRLRLHGNANVFVE